MIKNILGIIIRIIDWVIERKKKNETPEAIELRKKQATDVAIAHGDVDTINKQLEHELREPRKVSSNSK